jgi:hypothetical protein
LNIISEEFLKIIELKLKNIKINKINEETIVFNDSSITGHMNILIESFLKKNNYIFYYNKEEEGDFIEI